jgi:tRNA A37 threonylcarbamoyladenosine dehydratase
MQNPFSRTQMLFGHAAIETLQKSHVAVFGIGGVGGYAVEVLTRSGVGEITLIDNDRVSWSNINRQIYALTSTIGLLKVDVAKARIIDINPSCVVHCYSMFYLPENADEIDLSTYDYVVDCIDTVKAKLELIRRCHRLNVPLISSMGAANKVDPTAFRVADLSETNMDPLARILRKTLRKEGIAHLKVVYSEEQPLVPVECEIQGELTKEEVFSSCRPIPTSNAFVPAAAGLIVGGEVVKDLIHFSS